MAGNGENIDAPHEETTYRLGKELIGSRRPFNSQSNWTTRPKRTQTEGGPSLFPIPVGENGTYDPTRYIPIVELENRQLRRRLEEANRRNAELECEAAAARTTQENDTQNQPDPGERAPRGRPRNSQTRWQETAQGNP
uniref:Uncharacterized protein n=1 Tax=Cannabis sativa TaxID=3483 RepID=A0A803QD22_CANSA